jgi:hypothetical protein
LQILDGSDVGLFEFVNQFRWYVLQFHKSSITLHPKNNIANSYKRKSSLQRKFYKLFFGNMLFLEKMAKMQDFDGF